MLRRLPFCLPAALLVACSGNVVPNAPAYSASQRGGETIRDLGRSGAREPARIVVLLRYNHQQELERFVRTLERASRPRYLTHDEFLQRYAPTVQQEQRAVDILEREGFHITRRYANRLLIDATAPAVTVDRVLSTEIHNFSEAGRGIRTANVRPIRIPAELSPYVTAIEADSRVLAHVRLETHRTPRATSQNIVKNGSFDSGKLAPWTSCGSTTASISREHPESGRYDALTGSMAEEPQGWSAICQAVTIPPQATLTAWLYQVTNERNQKNAYQEIALADASGKPVVVLWKGNIDYPAWMQRTWDLSQYAGKNLSLFFGVHGSGRKTYRDAQFVDGVSLTGVLPSPSPSPSPTPLPGNGPGNTWGPSNVAEGLQMPSTLGNNGQGQTAAVVIDATVSAADLQAYLQYFQIPFTGTVTYESIDGGGDDSLDIGEATLDVETIASLAPAANIIVYNPAELSNEDIEDAYNQVVSDGKAKVVNSSFGECETVDPNFPSLTDTIAMGAVAQGVTFSASSGDDGVTCYYEGAFVPGVNAPASDAHFVGVGGTETAAIGGKSVPITNPVVWNDVIGAGGGGVSGVWITPSYQKGIAGASTSGRNVPDIALPAGYDSLFLEGEWASVWGTSWSSPIYVAMQTEINAACGSPQWGINVLYDAYAKSAYNDFIDVTQGNNSDQGFTGYSATTGFDNVSGIGIPLGVKIAGDTCQTAANRRLH
jgi:subtilase family serine protease